MSTSKSEGSMRKPEAWTAHDHGDPVYVYDQSEADEYIQHLEAQLAEVTTERDWWKNNVRELENKLAEAVVDCKSNMNGWREAERRRDELLDAVDLYFKTGDDPCDKCSVEANYQAEMALRKLAARIRKGDA